MLEKWKKIFQGKDDKKKTENLVAFLVILVVTLIIMNKILNSDSGSKEGMYQNQTGVELVSAPKEETVLVDKGEDALEKNLEEILSKIKGVRNSGCFDYVSKREYLQNRRRYCAGGRCTVMPILRRILCLQ